MQTNEPLPLNQTTDPFLKRCLAHINYTEETGLNTPASDVLRYRFNASMIHSFDSSIDKDNTHGIEHLILRNSDRGVDTEVTPTFANWVPLQSQAQYDTAAEFSCTIDEWLTYYNARYFMLENECSVISFSDEDTFEVRRFSNEKKLQDFAKHMEIAPYNRYATITNDVWLEALQPKYLWYSKAALIGIKKTIDDWLNPWRSAYDDNLPGSKAAVVNTVEQPVATLPATLDCNDDKAHDLKRLNASFDPFVKFVNYEGLLVEIENNEQDYSLYKIEGAMSIECVEQDEGQLSEKILFTSHDETREINVSFKNWIPLHERKLYEDITTHGCENNTVLKYFKARHFALESGKLLLSLAANNTMELRQFHNSERLHRYAAEQHVAPYEKYAAVTNDAWLENFSPKLLWLNDEKRELVSMGDTMYQEHLEKLGTGFYERDHDKAVHTGDVARLSSKPESPDILTKTQEWVKAVNWHQVEAVESSELDAVLKIQKNVKLLNEQQQRLEKKLHQEVATLLQKPASRKAIEKLPESQRKLFLSQEKTLTQTVERGVSHGF